MKKQMILVAAFGLLTWEAKADNGVVVENDVPVDSQFVWNKNLDEVVVTGQGGAIAKRRLSSNITKLSAEELSLFPTNRIDQMLQNALPNVQVTLTNGQPGTTSMIKSRGLSSAFTNSTPVIYVDGVRVDNLNTGSSLFNVLNLTTSTLARRCSTCSTMPTEILTARRPHRAPSVTFQWRTSTT